MFCLWICVELDGIIKKIKKEMILLIISKIFKNRRLESGVAPNSSALVPLSNELSYCDGVYTYRSYGFIKFKNLIGIEVKYNDKVISKLTAEILHNNNIVITDMFTEPDHRRKGIARTSLSKFCDLVDKASCRTKVYANVTSCDSSFPQDELEKFYNRYGIINGGAYSMDLALSDDVLDN